MVLPRFCHVTVVLSISFSSLIHFYPPTTDLFSLLFLCLYEILQKLSLPLVEYLSSTHSRYSFSSPPSYLSIILFPLFISFLSLLFYKLFITFIALCFSCLLYPSCLCLSLSLNSISIIYFYAADPMISKIVMQQMELICAKTEGVVLTLPHCHILLLYASL